MKHTLTVLVSLTLAGVSPASAQFAVDHPPYPFGGSGSDTELPTTSLPFTWQASADDFVLSSAAHVKYANWWGFHAEGIAPPSETLRLRLYRATASDDLPGELLFEESFDNPERIDTGRTIAIGGRPIEYRYHVALGKAWDLEPGVRYWLEVLQVGDRQSGFRFEYSLTDINSFAFHNNLFPDWRLLTLTPDLAFQLIVPEPASVAFALLGIVLLARRRRLRGTAMQN